MTSNRHHHQFIVGHGNSHGCCDIEIRFSIQRIPLSVAGRVGQIKPTHFTRTLIVVIEPWDTGLNRIANMVVMSSIFVPRNNTFATQRGLGQANHNLGFAAEIAGDGFEFSFRHLHHAHRVFAGDKLVLAVDDIGIGPAETGEDDGFFAGHQMTSIQLGRNLHGEVAILQRIGCIFSIWAR